MPFSREKHADDKEHKNPKIFLNREVVVTEKLDGGAAALCEGDIQARAQGHTIHGSFDYIKATHAWKTFAYPGLFWYGENMAGIHSIEYDGLTDFLYLYALRRDDRFFSWDDLVSHGVAADMKVVPLVYRGIFRSLDEMERFLDTEIKKPSAFGPTREGFCVRIVEGYDAKDHTEATAKYVRLGHVLTDSHWSQNWRHASLKKN
jgi:hypothetical protein